MTVSRKEVQHIAKLARLRFSEEEEELLAKDMSTILSYMDKLNQVDTSDVPPMTHVLDLAGVVRDDEVEQRIDHDDALSGAPDADSDYFRVPKVIGQERS